MPKVGIVVPTMGTRPDYLPQCLNSIQKAGTGENAAYVVMVAPTTFDAKEFITTGLVHKIVADPGIGLSEAINAGFDAMPGEIEYINWLGDDDLLTEGSLDSGANHLDANPNTVMVFGGSDYISPEGKKLWTNNSGPWVVPLMRFGPNLTPQPGALFRKKSFFDVGGLNPEYGWAFDFDLFIKFSKIGKLSFLNRVVSSFRWHPQSLSVRQRNMSVAEASRIRVSHLPGILKPISLIWELPVRWATLYAGTVVSARARKAEKI
jgi:hypothetical protein